MRLLSLFTALFISFTALADSPLTSTYFANVYTEDARIAALVKMNMDGVGSRFDLSAVDYQLLDRRDISLDVKIALVNALGWGENGNISAYINHLSNKYSIDRISIISTLVFDTTATEDLPIDVQSIHYHDLVVLSYMQAMHDYLTPINAIRPAYHAALNNPESESTWWVLALISSQIMFDLDWCMVYGECAAVLEMQASFTKDQLRPEAVSAIMEYVGLYQEYCETDYSEEFVDDSAWYLTLTHEWYTDFPVYTRPAAPQVSDKKNTVNLKLLNSDEKPYYERWITYDSENDGTRVAIRVANKGNTGSIETNAAITIAPDEYGTPELHSQVKIPALKPGEEVELTLFISGYWIYNPNADFRIDLDFDNNILETDEQDNSGTFYEEG
ncbi:MAG: CARDB domain-containing protein [Flavobacteriales bacterium]